MPLNIDISNLEKQYNDEVNRLKRQAKLKLQRVGEVYASTAKQKGNYKDQTSNLRNAHGYGIFEDGSLADNASGRPETEQGIKDHPIKADIEVVCGNGMDYASYVQRKGYDVTDSGQLAAEAEARKQFSK